MKDSFVDVVPTVEKATEPLVICYFRCSLLHACIAKKLR